MANIIGNPYITGQVLDRTRIDNFIPNVWTDDVRYYRDAAFVLSMVTQVKNVQGQQGDTYHVPLIGRAAVNTRVPGKPVQAQARTPGKYEVKVDQDKESSFSVDSIVKIQSQYDQQMIYTREHGYALGRDLDNALLALRAGIPTSQQIFRTIGTGEGTAAGTPAAIDEATLLAALQLMLEANVPLQDCAWVFSPKQIVDLMELDIIKNADYSVGTLNVRNANMGAVGTLYTLPVYSTTQISNNSLVGLINGEGATPGPTPGVAGSLYLPTQDTIIGGGLPRGQTGSETVNPFQTGMLVHPEWAYLLKQLDVTVTQSFENSLQMDLVVFRHVYGCRLYRNDHVVLMHTAGN